MAIAVPGQSGLARFIKLPPVERKKIPDIVKYEARQQIPFALEDVVWDYQPLIGSEDEGYAIETEVGLFAMKRDQVARHLKPLEDAGIDVEIIQLAPLAIYNFVCFDRLNVEGPYDPANPPQSTVIISLGTDTTDLVITNGYRVWQRSIPIGGNHFTKALTKELKLTFAKAEHLKRNAMKAENPKAMFQAMRPVFSDLVAEIQRSIGFFTSNNRNAKLGEMVALGNPMKLPGLQRFLSQNLDQQVKLVDQFNNLATRHGDRGPAVQRKPAHVRRRLWPVRASARACAASHESAAGRNHHHAAGEGEKALGRCGRRAPVGRTDDQLLHALRRAAHGQQRRSADGDPNRKRRRDRHRQRLTLLTENTNLVGQFDKVVTTAKNLQSNVDGRLLWLELFKAIDAALPRDTRPPISGWKPKTTSPSARRFTLKGSNASSCRT